MYTPFRGGIHTTLCVVFYLFYFVSRETLTNNNIMDGKTFPKSMDQILADVVIIWKRVNPEALREIKKINDRYDGFLLIVNEQSRREKIEEIKAAIESQKGNSIDKNVNKLYAMGMLPRKGEDLAKKG